MRQTLEPASFSDAAFAAREQAEVFGRGWQLVAATSELEAAHSHLRITVAGRDWILRRGADGALRCLANVCLHRGTRICNAPRGQGPLRCAYHGWTYDDAGQLIGVPFQKDFPALVPGEMALPTASVEVWGPAVFVNPDPAALDLRATLGPLFLQLDPVMQAMDQLLDVCAIDVEANWKLVMENALETYHVGFIHAGSIQPLGFAVERTDFHGPHSVSHYTAPRSPRKDRALAFAFPDRPLPLDGYLHANVFPCSTVATAYGNFFVLTRTEPLASDRCRLHWYVFSTRCGPRSAAAIAAAQLGDASNRAFVRRTFEEDAGICAAAHAGVRESLQRGYLGAQEARLLAFERGIARAMADDGIEPDILVPATSPPRRPTPA